jgi:hypothetical protein
VYVTFYDLLPGPGVLLHEGDLHAEVIYLLSLLNLLLLSVYEACRVVEDISQSFE